MSRSHRESYRAHLSPAQEAMQRATIARIHQVIPDARRAIRSGLEFDDPGITRLHQDRGQRLEPAVVPSTSPVTASHAAEVYDLELVRARQRVDAAHGVGDPESAAITEARSPSPVATTPEYATGQPTGAPYTGEVAATPVSLTEGQLLSVEDYLRARREQVEQAFGPGGETPSELAA
jgi:hypothetical protein